MKFKVYRGLLHLSYESLWYTCQGDFVVVTKKKSTKLGYLIRVSEKCLNKKLLMSKE